MPVFRCQGKVVYFSHIPKCAGTSVERFMKRNSDASGWISTNGTSEPFLHRYMRCSPQHIHADLAAHIFPMQRFDFTFAVVRDPMRRVISEYRMRRSLRKEQGIQPFGVWLDDVFSKFSKNPYILDNHIRPAHEFLTPDMRVYRLEDGLDAVLSQIAKDLGADLDMAKVPHVLSRKTADDDPVMPSPEEEARIRAFYARDYEILGYD